MTHKEVNSELIHLQIYISFQTFTLYTKLSTLNPCFKLAKKIDKKTVYQNQCPQC